MSVATPIFDFVSEYKKSGFSRFHMPGHKGVNSPLSVEERDITEIKGADYLVEADGIIGESERICGEIFGSGKTLYSTEGSSLSIKTMVTLAILARKNKAKRGQIIAPDGQSKQSEKGKYDYVLRAMKRHGSK